MQVISVVLNRNLIKDEQFDGVMSETERHVWQAFKSVANNFLGNKTIIKCVFIFQEMMQSFKALGASM